MSSSVVFTVEGAGITLSSTSIVLQEDDPREAFPDGKSVEQITRHCTACHSAGMILSQPHADAAQWRATIEKMDNVFGAVIPSAERDAILAELVSLSE